MIKSVHEDAYKVIVDFVNFKNFYIFEERVSMRIVW